MTSHTPRDVATALHTRALDLLQQRLGPPPSDDEIQRLSAGTFPAAQRLEALRRLAAYPELFARYLSRSPQEDADPAPTFLIGGTARPPFDFPIWALPGFEASSRRNALVQAQMRANDESVPILDEIHQQDGWSFMHRAEDDGLFVRVEHEGIGVAGMIVELTSLGGLQSSTILASAVTNEDGEARLRPSVGLLTGTRETAYRVRYPADTDA